MMNDAIEIQGIECLSGRLKDVASRSVPTAFLDSTSFYQQSNRPRRVSVFCTDPRKHRLQPALFVLLSFILFHETDNTASTFDLRLPCSSQLSVLFDDDGSFFSISCDIEQLLDY